MSLKYPNLEPVQILDDFSKYVMKNCKNIVVVFDDIDDFRPLYSKYFKNLLIGQAHYNLDFIFISRRPFWLPKELLENATDIIIFSCYPYDFEFFRKYYGVNQEIPKRRGEYIWIKNYLE